LLSLNVTASGREAEPHQYNHGGFLKASQDRSQDDAHVYRTPITKYKHSFIKHSKILAEIFNLKRR
jgi:hypothetical protein